MKRQKHNISQYDAMKLVRKDMPPPSRAHDGSKYKRDKSWKFREDC